MKHIKLYESFDKDIYRHIEEISESKFNYLAEYDTVPFNESEIDNIENLGLTLDNSPFNIDFYEAPYLYRDDKILDVCRIYNNRIVLNMYNLKDDKYLLSAGLNYDSNMSFANKNDTSNYFYEEKYYIIDQFDGLQNFTKFVYDKLK